MKLFIDASALVAIIANEPEGANFKAAIDQTEEPLWSAMSCWESISSLCSSYRLTTQEARNIVEETAALGTFRLVSIDDTERSIALDAYEQFGKGSGHRAQLNMGDCFAYACAKANDAALLYKGNDFIHTDLR